MELAKLGLRPADPQAGAARVKAWYYVTSLSQANGKFLLNITAEEASGQSPALNRVKENCPDKTVV